MRRLFCLLLVSAAAPAFAAPVVFSESRDKRASTVVVHGDSAEFTKADQIIIQAKLAEPCTLENDGDSVVMTGNLEVPAEVAKDSWDIRLGLLAAPPQGDSGWLGYLVLTWKDSLSLYRRDGGTTANGGYLSMTSATNLPLKAESPAKLIRLPGRYAFKLTLTKANTGMDCRLEMTNGESPGLVLSGNDPKPKTFRFDRVGFQLHCPKGENLKLGNVDVSFRKAGDTTPIGTSDATSAEAAGQSNTLLILSLVGGAVVLAGAGAAFVKLRRRPAPAVVIPPPGFGSPPVKTPVRPPMKSPGKPPLPPPPGAE